MTKGWIYGMNGCKKMEGQVELD